MDINEKLKDQKYADAYSETKLFEKIIKFAKSAGIKVIYAALLLFFTLQKPATPVWAKTMIIGALGYFIFPVDFIPDFIPIAGYTDDLAALVAAIVAVAMYIDEDVKQKSKAKLHDWFKAYDESELNNVDNKINN
ncbi:MAG TPA: DUF1232 domain-containing protein [Clostridia bacterium]|nr:DUF1232 domain-containing protein [Clostridia bacterium]